VAAKLRVVSTLQTQKTFVSPSGKFAKTKFRTIERFSVGEVSEDRVHCHVSCPQCSSD